jgi:hypothetical protein
VNRVQAFPIHIVLSLTTGVLMRKPFSDVHECIEWVLGRPVLTHELASKKLSDIIATVVLSQLPVLEELPEYVDDTENYISVAMKILCVRELPLLRGQS